MFHVNDEPEGKCLYTETTKLYRHLLLYFTLKLEIIFGYVCVLLPFLGMIFKIVHIPVLTHIHLKKEVIYDDKMCIALI